jgi:hypothetical protein
MRIKEITFNELYYGFNEKLLTIVLPREDNYKPKTKWVLIAKSWFWNGLDKDWKFIPRSGVSKEAAMKHIQALLNTYCLSKEDKIKYSAKLMSLWFDQFEGRIEN